MTEYYAGQTVYLKEPYRGYRAVYLVEKYHYKWLVRFVDSGLEMEFYEDEFELE
jgi:hypothetical protein